MAVALTGRLTSFGIFGGIVAERALEHDGVRRRGRPADRPARTARRRRPSGPSPRRPGARGSARSRRRAASSWSTVATLRRSSGRYFPFCARNWRRSASPSAGIVFSNPSGMSDFFEEASSSMSSRRIVCFFPSASSSSIEVFVSPASRPFRTRPSVVETVYWRKFPSTDRLGSRMWTSSSLFGCAAMPVRSGPTLPPSPECVWHLAHSFLKTSLPREASPPFRTTGDRAWMTFSRSGSGRPPPLASRALARSAMDLSGCAARACDCESVSSDIGTLPASIAPTSEPVQSVLPSSARTHGLPRGRRHRPHRVDEGRPDLGRVALRDGGDQPARHLGRRLRRDQRDQVASGLRVALAEVDELPRGVDAGGIALRGVGRGGEEVLGELRRRSPSSPFTPQREASPSIWPRESVESFGSSAAIAFSASASSSGALSLGQPFANPATMASRTFASASGSWRRISPSMRFAGRRVRNARTRARRRRGPRGSGLSPTCGSRRSGGSPRRPAPRPRRRHRGASGRCRPPRRRRPKRRRPRSSLAGVGIRQRQESGEPDELLAVLQAARTSRSSGAATFGGNASAAFRRTDGRRMRERRLLHAGERRLDAVEHAEAARRPQGMDHGRREAEGVARRVLLDDRRAGRP